MLFLARWVKGQTADAIKELRRQGIEVDDDNEPAPENAEATAPVANGQWKKPTMCPRRMANIPNYKGKFNSHSWEDIAKMNELDQGRMCFPEQFVIDVIIPETNKNKHLVGTPLTLQESYVWLGCIFYMACFEGIGDRDEWWSSSPIDQFKGAPFQLNGFMSKNHFVDIMGALRYTDVQQPLLFEDRYTARHR